MATWPATLPDLSLDGYSVTLIDPVIRTDMDAGNTRMRRRFSRAQDKITARWVMNKTQVDTFEGFHRSTIQNGAQPFTMSIRVGASATNVTARFLDAYTIKFVAPNWWEVTGSLLIDDRDGYGTAPVPTTPPQNTVAPVITGTPTQGLTLSTNLGTWTGTQPISYGYQWKRGGSNISGATSSTYTLVQADIGALMTCQIAAQNVAGSNTATTASVGPVIAASAPVNTGVPSITGGVNQGQVLTVHVGTWSGTVPITYTYQWKRDDVNISNAESVTYLLVLADVGTSVSCDVTATNLVGSATQESNTVGPIGVPLAAPVNTVAPVITGTVIQGNTLNCSSGTWTGATPITFGYLWNGAGANKTTSTYLLVTGDVGNTISCTVTANNSVGSTPAVAAAVGPITASVATKPRYGKGGAVLDSDAGGKAALFGDMTVVSSASDGSRVAGSSGSPLSIDLDSQPGVYGWFACVGTGAPSGVTFNNFLGSEEWDGAGRSGEFAGNSPEIIPSVRHISYTDGQGVTWFLYRQNLSETSVTFWTT